MNTEEQRKTAAAVSRMAQAASSLADGVRRELGGGELTRIASSLAVDLEALALRLAETSASNPPTKRPCARCGQAMAGVEGLCGPCEAQLRS